MKSLFRCVECGEYTLREENCPHCGEVVEYPYPAKFSLVKEKKYRHLIRKQRQEAEN